MPVSTTEVTRRSFTSPCSSTSASTTVAMKVSKLGCTQTPRPTRQRLAPIGFFRGEIECCQHARLFSKHRPAEVNRILARLAGEFIHEAFDGEHVVVRTDAAPETG